MRVSRMLMTGLILMMLGVMPLKTQAQEWEFTVHTVQAGDDHVARIIPLYEDFDFMLSLLSGELNATDFQRENRFIMQCAFLMQSALTRTGQDDLLSGVFSGVLADRWRIYADDLRRYDVMTEIETALHDSAALLPPRQNFSVCIIPGLSLLPDMAFRQGGFASSNALLLALNVPESDDDEWQSAVRLLVAHEYHHVVRYSSPNTRESGHTLLTRLVVEGMAETFMGMVYPDMLPDETLSPEQEAELWADILPLLETTSRTIQNQWMFGGDTYTGGEIPSRAGYIIGYRLMQSYLAGNPTVELAEWSTMDARTIFEMSNYQP